MANTDLTLVHNDDLDALILTVHRMAFLNEMLEKQINDVEESLRLIQTKNINASMDQ